MMQTLKSLSQPNRWLLPLGNSSFSLYPSQIMFSLTGSQTDGLVIGFLYRTEQRRVFVVIFGWFLYLLLAIVGVTEFQQFTPTSYQDNCSNISVSFWTITVGKLASFWIGVILWVSYACLLGFTFFCKLLWWHLTLFPKQVSPVGSPKSQFESTVEKFSSLSVITNISFALIWSCLPLWSYPGLSSGSQITKLSQGLRSLGAVCINNTHGIVPVLWTPLLIC